MIDIFKAVILGIVEGITEFLPISSTGHLLLLNQWIRFENRDFNILFNIVIQFGAILSVVLIFRKRLFPFGGSSTPESRRSAVALWFKSIIGFVPIGLAAFLFGDWIQDRFFNAFTVAGTLIVYGILFILIESMQRKPRVETMDALSYPLALAIGAVQILSLIPGTSRSGVTIIGAMLLGTSRVVASEFTFFMAVPTMGTASLYSVYKFLKESGTGFTTPEITALAVGFIVSFLVAWAVVVAFLKFVQKHDFSGFGVYRIVLGVVVLGYFLLTGAAVVE